MNEERFTFHLHYKHSGTFANRKNEELSYAKYPKMCDPIMVILLKMRPPLQSIQSYKEVLPPLGFSSSLITRESRSMVYHIYTTT